MKHLLSLLAILSISCAFAQDAQYSSTNKKAIELYEKGGMYFNAHTNVSARDQVKKALELDPNFAEAWLLLGNIYAALGDQPQAIECYKKQIEISPKLSKMTYKYLGLLQFAQQRYPEAKDNFDSLLRYADISDKLRKELKKLSIDAEFATEAIKHPIDIKLVNLGPKINTRTGEYTPAISGDDSLIIFTRMVNGQEDFYWSKRYLSDWYPAIPLSDKINTPNLNEGAQSISPDGQYMFMTLCNHLESKGGCDIYYASFKGNQWSQAVNMSEVVNSVYNERQPAISSTGQTLYFVSNRPGGFGGEDIWYSLYQGNGKWGTPINAGPSINTSGNEESPFIHADGKTLYFSSEGWPGMGGKDLYLVRKDDKGLWGQAQNLGYPMNTMGDERSVIVNTEGTVGYTSTNTAGGIGDFDIYSFKLPAELKPALVTYVKGLVFDKDSKRPLSASVEIVNLKSGQRIYKEQSNSISGDFLACLAAGDNYALDVSAPGYLFYSRNFALENKQSLEPYLLEIPLQKIAVGEKVVLNNIFFQLKSAELTKESLVELMKIGEFLRTNPSTKIELGGHTDNTGEAAFNQKLSENRAKSVYDYLVQDGIAAERLSFKGYGSTQPVGDNSTDEGKAKNRRTELKITN